MDKRIMTELLLTAKQCDHENRGKVIICLMEMFSILDSHIEIEIQLKDSCYEIIEAEANLIWMRTHRHLLSEGIRMGSIDSYMHHLNSTTSYNPYLVNVN